MTVYKSFRMSSENNYLDNNILQSDCRHTHKPKREYLLVNKASYFGATN